MVKESAMMDESIWTSLPKSVQTSLADVSSHARRFRHVGPQSTLWNEDQAWNAKWLFVGEVWKLDFFQRSSETQKISWTLMDGSTSTYPPLCKTHLDFLKLYNKFSTVGCHLLVFSLLIRYYLVSAPKLLCMDPTKVYHLWKYTWMHAFILESFQWH